MLDVGMSVSRSMFLGPTEAPKPLRLRSTADRGWAANSARSYRALFGNVLDSTAGRRSAWPSDYRKRQPGWWERCGDRGRRGSARRPHLTASHSLRLSGSLPSG